MATKYTVMELNEACGRVLTIGDILRLAVSIFNKYELFFGHGSDNAYDEAIYLILYTLYLPLDQLEPYMNARLLDSEINRLLDVLEQRVAKRVPASYITKQANLAGYSFYVDERVIIPRSFLAEIMLNDKLCPWIEYPQLVKNVLDLCSGNGSLAVIAANYFSDSFIVASDINAAALEVASINVKEHNLSNRIDLCQSDVFANLDNYKNTFDLILANPPYVDKNKMDSLPAEYLHEPYIALSGSDNGLAIVEEIIEGALEYLTDYGVLVMEIGDNKVELEQSYPGLEFTWLEAASDEGIVFVLTRQNLSDYFN